jgi:modification methylase
VRGASTRSHPAPFPVELAEQMIRMFSFVGDIVLDPFAGTGSTSIAAARAGRNSLGIEIEPGYQKIALQRLREAVRTDGLPATVTAVNRLIVPDVQRQV